MKNKILSTLPILALLSLTGCLSSVPKDFQFDKTSNDGIFVATFTLDDQCGKVEYFATSIYLEGSIKNLSPSHFTLPVAGINDTDSLQNKTGTYHMYMLKAGKYNIGRPTMTMRGSYSNNANLFEFEIKPREVTYIGEIAFMVDTDCRKYYSKVIDSWSETKPLYVQRINNIPPEFVVKNLATKIENPPNQTK